MTEVDAERELLGFDFAAERELAAVGADEADDEFDSMLTLSSTIHQLLDDTDTPAPATAGTRSLTTTSLTAPPSLCLPHRGSDVGRSRRSRFGAVGWAASDRSDGSAEAGGGRRAHAAVVRTRNQTGRSEHAAADDGGGDHSGLRTGPLMNSNHIRSNRYRD